MARLLSPLGLALNHGDGVRLAAYLGVHTEVVSRWVTGRRCPPVCTALRIEQWCRDRGVSVSLAELLGVKIPPGCRVRPTDPAPGATAPAALDSTDDDNGDAAAPDGPFFAPGFFDEVG